MKGKKTSLITAAMAPLMVGATWYGSQMGSGTASGANHMNYFVRFGWYCFIFAAIALVLELWYYYWVFELSRTTKKYESRAFLTEAFYPYEKALLPIYDILAIAAFTISTGSCLAGAAEVMVTYFDMNYFLGLVIWTVVFMALALFGMKAIRAVGTTLTIAMIAIVLVVLIIGIPANWDSIVENISTRAVGEGSMYGSVWWAVWYVFLFAALQTQTASTMSVHCEGVINTKRDSLKAALFAFCLLFITMVPLSLLLLGRWPGNLNGTSIYILEAIENLPGAAFVKAAYPILLMCAFVTTGPNFLFNQTERWSNAGFWRGIKDSNPFSNMKLRRFVVALIYLAICFVLAVRGFGFVTNTLMPALSYGWILLLVVFGIATPIRVRKMRREYEKTGHVTTAAELRGNIN